MQCGWLKDTYGLSWQIVPTVLGELVSDKDPAKAHRVMQALLQMVTLDIRKLKQAAKQNSPMTLMPTAKAKPGNIDEYLSAVSADKRTALEKLRRTIKAAAPGAEECISYGLAAFRLKGRLLVAFGAWANHCALYPMSSATAKAFRDQLKDFETSKGTIRFSPAKTLPAALVKKLVKARIAENDA